MAKPNSNPTTHKAKRLLKNKSPKLIENHKTTLVLKSTKTSDTTRNFLKDFIRLKPSECRLLNKKNKILPFEDSSRLEFLCKMNDCSLFVFASHSKKRPDNICLGRMFDHSTLDIMEFGISEYKGISEFKAKKFSTSPNSKPLLFFKGKSFAPGEKLDKTKSLLLDLFRGKETRTIDLKSLSRILVFQANDEDSISVSHFAMGISTPSDPRVSLEEIGPLFRLTARRSLEASEEVRKEAMPAPPRAVVPKKVKNVDVDSLLNKTGRVYVDRQNVGEIAKRKFKGYKRRRQGEQKAEENK